jgi:hypothetical protein
MEMQTDTNTGDQYSATMNARDLPSRIRTCLICTVYRHEWYRGEHDDVESRSPPIAKETCGPYA